MNQRLSLLSPSRGVRSGTTTTENDTGEVRKASIKRGWRMQRRDHNKMGVFPFCVSFSTSPLLAFSENARVAGSKRRRFTQTNFPFPTADRRFSRSHARSALSQSLSACRRVPSDPSRPILIPPLLIGMANATTTKRAIHHLRPRRPSQQQLFDAANAGGNAVTVAAAVMPRRISIFHFLFPERELLRLRGRPTQPRPPKRHCQIR